MASAPKTYHGLHASSTIQNERPDRARVQQSFAAALNQLAGWQFRRAVEGIWEHHPRWSAAFPVTGFPIDGLPHVSGSPSTDLRRLELRWTASRHANYAWVAFTYFLDDNWSGGSLEPSVELSLYKADGTLIDLGCRFSVSTGDLVAGYDWVGDAGDDEFGRLNELNCVPHMAHTGFVTQPITSLSITPRPLYLASSQGDDILRIANVGVVITSVSAFEMWETTV